MPRRDGLQPAYIGTLLLFVFAKFVSRREKGLSGVCLCMPCRLDDVHLVTYKHECETIARFALFETFSQSRPFPPSAFLLAQNPMGNATLAS